MLELEPHRQQGNNRRLDAITPWRVVALTSSSWLLVLTLMAAGFFSVLERQERKIELLLQRTTPIDQPLSPRTQRNN